MLQETTSDELRGRTFATLYTVVRLCLLISLTISPLWADFWDWVTEAILGPDQTVDIGPYSYALPGVRIALWGGGLIALGAGLVAWRSIRRAARTSPTDGAELAAADAVDRGIHRVVVAVCRPRCRGSDRCRPCERHRGAVGHGARRSPRRRPERDAG